MPFKIACAEENKIIKKALVLRIEGARGKIIYHQIMGYEAKTFLISFVDKRKSLSTLEGFKEISFVVNHSIPRELYNFVHSHTEEYERKICEDLEIKRNETALLLTGADIDRSSIKMEKFGNFEVFVCVTAGVTNAQRIGVDKAGYIERDKGEFKGLGTINTIVLTNASLTQAAMARSIITITEAKTIALQDLDIRSSYNPDIRATGTGTDEIIIVSGFGPRISAVGGHTKAGELMARVVTSAVREAILKTK